MNLNTWLIQERGRAARLAAAEGVSQPTVSDWSTGKKPIPQNRGPGIERFTSGAVTVEELLPALTWVRIPDAAWPHPSGRPLLDVSSTDATVEARGLAANA